MSQRKRLALVDGHALAFRAFHALREQGFRSSSGEPTWAVFAFAQILLTTIQEQRPDYVAVSFDIGRTFRDDMYAEYKAGRAETPAEFHPQLDRIKQLVAALNIPVYVAEGFEADDVIGTLARQATAHDVETLILTGDTDSLQLVDDHVRVVLANPYGAKTTTTIYDEVRVRERYEGLAPSQLADLRGLKGDTSDNIPGVKGIGEKGAINLLKEFGTVENLYDHLAEAPNRYKKALDGQRDSALFSKKLATIVCDAPVQLDLRAAAIGDYDRGAVIALFQELEIGASSNLIKKLPANTAAAVQGEALPSSAAPPAEGQLDLFAAPAAPAATAEGQLALFDLPPAAAPPAPARPAHGSYRAVTTDEQLDALLEALRAAPGFAFDTESDGLRPFESAMVGVSISVSPGSAVYIPFGHREGEQLPRERVLDALRPLFADPQKPKYAHNAKFDIELLLSAGVEVRGLAFDTMIAAGLLGKRAGLKDLAFYELQLAEPMTAIEELIGRASKQITFGEVPVETATPYAAADADMTMRLVEPLRRQLAENERLQAIFRDLEMPLVDVLVSMEQAGITLDKGYIEGLGGKLSGRIEQLANEIYGMAGRSFNINSGQQLNEVLFDSGKFKLDPKKLQLSKLKSGGYSITAEVLEQMAAEEDIAARILQYRQLSKLKSTYIDALPQMVNPQTGRVHTSYSQLGAATGRLSCLPAGTLVNTQHGLVGIEEVRPGDLVRTVYGPRKVLAWAETGLKPVVVLRLSNGITLRCSPEHRLRSLGRWVEAGDIQVGAPLYMSYTPGMFGGETRLGLHHTSHYDTCKTPSLPTDWSVGLAELIGYHMADGHISRSSYNDKPANVILAFGWEDEELIAYFARQIRELFGKEPRYRKTRSCPVLTVAGVDIAGAFEQLGAGGKSGEIRVPPSLYRAPEAVVAGFLRGYFEGDGSVSADRISVRSVSRAMLADVQQLLTLFGIMSRIVGGQPDPHGYAPRHTLRIAGRRSNAIFQQRIGFLSTKKHLLAWGAAQQHEEPHTTHSSADLITLVPGFTSPALKPQLYATVRNGEGSLPQAVQTFASKLTRGKATTVTMARAEWLTRQLPADLADAGVNFLREAVQGQYFECSIIAIEHEPPVPMYDIAVDEVQQYIANGIALHNSVDPNLMNIPVRTEEGREIRKGFVAAEGCQLIAADYSQIELRVLAHITKDSNLLQAFQEGYDIHAATASGLFGVDVAKVDKNQRRVAKTTVFGVIYGISAFGLAQRLHIERSYAQNLINTLFERFPGIKAYIDSTLELGRREGFVYTLYGRRRPVPDLKVGGPRRAAAEREAINAPIQGTAADIMKLAMVNMHRALKDRGMQTRMLLQVHDELILEAPADEVDAACELVREVMEHAVALDVPLGVDVETGPNWEEMK